MVNERDYVDIGIAYANICKALYRVMSGTPRLDEHSQFLCDMIGQLTT